MKFLPVPEIPPAKWEDNENTENLPIKVLARTVIKMMSDRAENSNRLLDITYLFAQKNTINLLIIVFKVIGTVLFVLLSVYNAMNQIVQHVVAVLLLSPSL